MTTASIDGERLWQSIMAMAAIGATDRGGVRRLALSDVDREARDLFVRWCERAGLSVEVDGMGNIFARRAGRRDVPPVMLGSHLDTQPNGGKFDGIYGVMAALEVVRSMNDRGLETEAPVEIVDWTNEEGARFPPVMLGSGTFVGAFDLDYGLARTDGDGRTVGEELRRIGYAGAAAVGGRPVAAFLEAHIEQGPVLERAGLPVGIVTGAQGIAWYDVVVTGAESHAGTTPIEARRDALVAAAGIVRAAREIAVELAAEAARLTVGELRVEPGSRNTVPGRVVLGLDMRAPETPTMERMDTELRRACEREARSVGVEVRIERLSCSPPVAFDADIVGTVRAAAQAAGLAAMAIVSGATHDACHLARVAPAGMVFVPCENGLSHNELENAKPEDLAAGCEVLYRSALALANPGEAGG